MKPTHRTVRNCILSAFTALFLTIGSASACEEMHSTDVASIENADQMTAYLKRKGFITEDMSTEKQHEVLLAFVREPKDFLPKKMTLPALKDAPTLDAKGDS
ncbi:hypothetical protein [Veronia pacifica]|uniref:Uncharacterized protein n=1 Tax=Veronia pacifica TaxID=1080227 RepID=A0A1C3EQX0_9GAMM|nr:hypothetical protein [Veronia pacifica]ODA35645.1 hypothetical protein A8L45_03250 [Veronia pacifica]